MQIYFDPNLFYKPISRIQNCGSVSTDLDNLDLPIGVLQEGLVCLLLLGTICLRPLIKQYTKLDTGRP